MPWSTVLGAADRDAFEWGAIFGMAAQSDRVLLRGAAGSALRLAVLDAAGDLLTRADDSAFFAVQGSDTATAMPSNTGLLLFDGNPVRLTQIRFEFRARPSAGTAAAHVLSDAPRIGGRPASRAGRSPSG